MSTRADKTDVISVCQRFLKLNDIYHCSEIVALYLRVKPYVRGSGRLNVPAAFDIETTSFTAGGEKRAIMYAWTMNIYGLSVYGRTWAEFVKLCADLASLFKLTGKRRLVIYCHNLSFEFQFLRRWFTWRKVFALDRYKPVYAITDAGIEFRCSYLLSGYSLKILAKNLQYFDLKKKVGDLDYSLIRHSKTPLTDAEWGYCFEDTRIVVAYIAEEIERNGGISRIPLTKTGYVRRLLRKRCLSSPGYGSRLMKHLTMEPEEYEMLKDAFQGGFTHANPFYSKQTVNDVTSYDFSSAYPSVICSCLFPMSKGVRTESVKTEKELETYIARYCCIFDVCFYGLRSVNLNDSPISFSRCIVTGKRQTNNGRVVHADELRTTITEQDFLIYREFYAWDRMEIGVMYYYRRGYLPRPVIETVLELYKDKTTLKGVEGAEAEYLHAKELLNSCYGCTVQDPVRAEIVYTDDWEESKRPSIEAAINKYNADRQRFLFYPWGVYVTAYCRKNLFSGILECGEDYLYADTDSMKIINADRHRNYIDAFNRDMLDALRDMCDHYGIDPAAIEPETVKGVKKPLGVWDFDGQYKRFKTLGAKRYLVEYPDGSLKITVSGLRKDLAVEYLQQRYKDPFRGFTDKLYVPGEYTGKQTHTYLNTAFSGTLKDYTGREADYRELSAVHLAPADYTLSMTGDYVNYLKHLTGGFFEE